MPRRAGRHFLQIPGPTNVPDRVLRAIDFPTIDHRGPEFGVLGKNVLAGMKRVFKSTQGEVVIYPASGTGAWEAALVNTLSAGDRVLMYETGHFATLWQKMAAKLGLEVEFIAADWRRGADPEAIEKRLRADADKRIKAVGVVHNETSTGVVSRIAEVRRAIDAAGHPALLMVDTISSLASMDYRHDEWGVDVTVAGSQKGLMLPPGLSFNCISPKALAAAKSARLPRSYWAWDEMVANGKTGYFPYTPATNLLYGLAEALKMLLDEEGLDADRVRKVILEAFDLSLGTGLTKLGGKMFRIGHLGDFNDLTLMGTLAGVEMGFELAGVPVKKEGVSRAMQYLSECARAPARRAA
jgi:alanine-glyoxylate transaminase/serine-glyoxylate transaminase/serine-pyruvate transaminase